jgi:hypothetical protein
MCDMASWVVLWVLVVGQAPQAQADAARERLREANEALDALQLERAASLLEPLVANPEAPDDVRAQAFLALGLTRASQLNPDGARAAFAAALAIDPHAELPRDTSPKVRALFDDIRSALLPRGPPPRPGHERAIPPDPPPPPPPDARAGTQAPLPPAPPAAAEPGDTTPWVIGGVTLLGGSALAGAAALAADSILSVPVAGRSRSEYDSIRGLGIGALTSSIVLATAGALVLVGSATLVGADIAGEQR